MKRIFLRSSGIFQALRMSESLTPPRLSACLFDFFLGRLGESGSLHGELLGDVAVAQNLQPYSHSYRMPFASRACVDDRAVLELVESGDVDSRQGLGEDVVEAALGMRRARGIWPPSKPMRTLPPERAFWPLCPRPAVLPLPEPAPRPLRLASLVEPTAGEVHVIHPLAPPYSTSVTCSR